MGAGEGVQQMRAERLPEGEPLPVAVVGQAFEVSSGNPHSQPLMGALGTGTRRLLRAVVDKGPMSIRRAVEEEREYGHLFLFVPLLIGLGAFVWFSVQNPPGLIKSAVLLCVFGMASLALRSVTGMWRSAVIAAALLSCGMTLAALETWRRATVILDAPVTTRVAGTVLSREITDRGHWRYTVQIARTAEPVLKRPPHVATLLARSRHTPIDIGGGIAGRARLSPPSGPALPGLNDFAFDSYFRGGGAVGYFYSAPTRIEDVEEADTGGWAHLSQEVRRNLAELRAAIGTRIRDTIEGDAGAIAAALITGEERAISRPTIDALRQAGLAHVLAISGLNMVLAAGTFLIGARTMLSIVPGLAHRVPIKKVAAAGALVMVTLYILISGGAVSAVRSWIMISIMLVAVFFDRPSISLRNVALSAILILAVTPSAVTSPGFHMSFAATLALVAGYARWRSVREAAASSEARPAGRFTHVSGFFSGLFLSSIIGGVSTMIYSAGHFHSLAAYGLAGNLLAMPVISIFVMPFALIAMMLMPFGLDAFPLFVMGKGVEWMIVAATAVSSWGGEVATGRVPDAAFVLIALGGILVCLLRTWLAASGLAVVMVGVFIWSMATLDQPDLVISEDGRLVGLVQGNAVATNRGRPPDFIFSQWQRALRLGDPVKPGIRADLSVEDVAMSGTADAVGDDRRQARPPIDTAKATRALREVFETAGTGRFLCVPDQWCGAHSAMGWRVAVVEDARFVGPACDTADIVVTPVMLRLAACRSGARLLSARHLRRTGAVMIFRVPPTAEETLTSSGMRIVASQTRLDRPWQIHRAYDWRTDRFDLEKPATTEDRIFLIK